MSQTLERLRVEGSDGAGLSVILRTPGQGDAALPTVIFTNGFACPTFYWDALHDRLGGRARLVTWDFKGHGESEPARSEATATIPEAAADLGRVMDAVGVDAGHPAILASFSVGCQVNLEAWRTLSDRIAGYALLLGTYEHPFRSLVHPLFGAQLERLLGVVQPGLAGPLLRTTARISKTGAGHRLNRLAKFVGSGATREVMDPFYDHLATLDPASALWMARSAARHTASDLLPRIDVPTLVIAGGHDRFTPPAIGKSMAEAIPGAEWTFLPDATHTGLLDLAEPIAGRTLAFLDRHHLLDRRG
ncbi:MAG: alpha/beta hydrolase [Deltaproteobacteria bacterium]|nr:alpha/beta hydrolase [Deltaproteobacteria bacterium]